MIDKRAVARHFSRAAATYDEAALVQADMARDLAVLCPALPAAPQILEIGCGTGLFTDRLLELYPAASLTIVDISPAMVEHCRVKYASCGNVRVVEADGECYTDDREYDCIVSAATLQWFCDPGAALARYRQQLHPGGMLLFSVLGEGTFVELFTAFREAYAGLGIPYIRTQGPPLYAAAFWKTALDGYDLQREERRIYTQYYPDVAAFLRDLRRTGASNAEDRRRETPPAAVRAMLESYRRAHPERIPVTYEGLFFSAKKV